MRQTHIQPRHLNQRIVSHQTGLHRAQLKQRTCTLASARRAVINDLAVQGLYIRLQGFVIQPVQAHTRLGIRQQQRIHACTDIRDMHIVHLDGYRQRVERGGIVALQGAHQKIVVMVVQIDVRAVDSHLANRHLPAQQVAHAHLHIYRTDIRQRVALLIGDIDIVDMQRIEEPVIDVPDIDIRLQRLRHLSRQPAHGCSLHLTVANKQRQHICNHQDAYQQYRYYVRKTFHTKNLAVDKVTRHAGEHNQQYRVRQGCNNLLHYGLLTADELWQNSQHKHSGKEHYTPAVDERSRRDQQQRSSSNQSQHRKPEIAQRVLEVRIVGKSRAEHQVQLTQRKHDHQPRQNHCTGSQHTAPHRACSRITHVGRAVDTYRTGSNLTDSYYIHKLLLAHPAVGKHLMLDK